MKPVPQPQVELRDVAPGLWIWRLEHPRWKPGQGWEPIVASTCVESRGETLLLDPLAPPEDAAEFWKRLDARPPTAVVVLKPDHVRDVDLFARRYNARAFGPRLFFREDIPKTELQFIEPGSQLPGGLVALYDGRGRNETPLWLPEQRTIVFADALTAQGASCASGPHPPIRSGHCPPCAHCSTFRSSASSSPTASLSTPAPPSSAPSISPPGPARPHPHLCTAAVTPHLFNTFPPHSNGIQRIT